MNQASSTNAKNFLRAHRSRRALGLDVNEEDERLSRNFLLEPLAIAADQWRDPHLIRDDLDVEMIISLALSRLEDNALESLGILMMCSSALATQGEFARLHAISEMIEQDTVRLKGREFLKVAIDALCQTFRGEFSTAEHKLQVALSDGGPVEFRNRRSPDQVRDVLVCLTLRCALEGNGEFIERARRAALEVQDGFLLAAVDAIGAWGASRLKADTTRVLIEADEVFADPILAEYLKMYGPATLLKPQILAIKAGVTKEINNVVALPTSSGKTLLAELRIAAHLKRFPGTQVLYVAPYRMLSRQVETGLTRGLASLGFSVRNIGSDFRDGLPFWTLGDSPDVSICTPERLDSILRGGTDQAQMNLSAAAFLGNISLLIFDELQMIGRPGRGVKFELLIMRLARTHRHIRFLGLCAAAQGTDELAGWLTNTKSISGASRPTGTLELVWGVDGALHQRVDDGQIEVGNIPRHNPRADAVRMITTLQGDWGPVLAVETRRPLAEALARDLATSMVARGMSLRESERSALLEDTIERCGTLFGEGHLLARCLDVGIAYHHAGVPTPLLEAIEELTRTKVLRAVVATTTVAEGSDLPFRSVVIPHLNFPGASKRLERDLYLNIIGRAGRAKISAGGLVVVLDSEARTLKNLVRSSLWANTTVDRVRSRIPEVQTRVHDQAEYNALKDLESQLVGWLGDGSGHLENQHLEFISQTFAWALCGSDFERTALSEKISAVLLSLESRKVIERGSPYRLTGSGSLVRRTGLAAWSVRQLEEISWAAVAESGLHEGIEKLDPHQATLIASILLGSLEVLEESLWLRSVAKSWGDRVAILRALEGLESESAPTVDALKVDASLIVSWVLGRSFVEMGSEVPIRGNRSVLFGKKEEFERASDAAEYIGGVSYAASWVWNGACVVAARMGVALPSFVVDSIEYGMPTTGGVELVRRLRVSRSAAGKLVSAGGRSWREVSSWLKFSSVDAILDLGLADVDQKIVVRFRSEA